MAHWVFFNGFAAETGGWIANKAEDVFLGGVGAYDFAGGTAIHINAGASRLSRWRCFSPTGSAGPRGRCGPTTSPSS